MPFMLPLALAGMHMERIHMSPPPVNARRDRVLHAGGRGRAGLCHGHGHAHESYAARVAGERRAPCRTLQGAVRLPELVVAADVAQRPAAISRKACSNTAVG